MTTEMEQLFAFDTLEVDQLFEDMKSAIVYASQNAPRSLQPELGPSEVGHPCPRQIAFGLMQEPKVAPQFDPLPSAVGTGAHGWFADAFEMDNARLGRQRWLIEHRVSPWTGLEGNTDLFDTDTKTVVDHKFLSADKVKHAAKHGPRLVYENQGQTYGAGLVAAGHEVRRVAIWLLPRGGLLAHSHLWHREFDPAVAERVRQRLHTILTLAVDLDVEHHPERYRLIPRDTSDCTFCKWKTTHPVPGAHCIPSEDE